MKSIGFCYWLQGLFKIQDVKELTEKQTQIIKNHLEMVFAHEPQPSNFCAFLNGFLKIQNPQSINPEQTAVIKKYLNNIFEHVVAPVVKPERKRSGDFEMMC